MQPDLILIFDQVNSSAAFVVLWETHKESLHSISWIAIFSGVAHELNREPEAYVFTDHEEELLSTIIPQFWGISRGIPNHFQIRELLRILVTMLSIWIIWVLISCFTLILLKSSLVPIRARIPIIAITTNTSKRVNFFYHKHSICKKNYYKKILF